MNTKLSRKIQLITFANIIFIILISLHLTGCAPLIVAGAAGGVAMATDRRTAGTVIEDKTIELKAFNKLHENNGFNKLYNVSITSYNERVLITGEAASARIKNKVEDIVKSIPKVATIYNEVNITSAQSKFTRSSYDTWLTTKVKSNITADARVNPLNIKVTTNNKVVYLMGLVTHKEAEIVTEIARGINGVNKVVKLFEYIEIKDDDKDTASQCK